MINPAITEARGAALELLHPERRQLEHGLALHRESVVMDAFCLGFMAAPDGAAIKAVMDAGASHEEVIDLMSSMSALQWASDPAQTPELAEALDASGLTGWMQNAEHAGVGLRQAARIADFLALTDRLPDHLSRAARAADVLKARKQGRRCLCLSLNHVPLAPRDGSPHDELTHIALFRRLGVRMMHLTYDRSNCIGDGCYEEMDGGLSDFGVQVVQEMNRCGVIVDAAHASNRTALDAARVSAHPVVVSHTACAALSNHPRGVSDEVIRAVADGGGYVGITCVPDFLGGSGDIRALLDHLDYAIRRFGADHVAIGTDAAYSGMQSAAQATKFPRPSQFYPARQQTPPPRHRPFLETPEQLRTMALTNWPLFTVGLVQRGHTDESIRQVIGGNVLRVLQASDG